MKSRHGYADGVFGQIHYRTSGIGYPVVLIHQSPLSSVQYTAAYPLLAAKGFRAIGVDLPGFGQSDPPPAPPHINDYAQAILTVMDQLQITRSHVVGHHTGSKVATALGVMAPDRVTRLVLHGAAPMNAVEQDQFRQHVQTEQAFAAKADASHILSLWNERLRYLPEPHAPEVMTRIVADQISGLGPMWYGHAAVAEYDQAAAFAAIKCPTLIISNTGDVLHRYALRARELRPDFSYVEIQGGGIDFVDERPQQWVETVAQFLRA